MRISLITACFAIALASQSPAQNIVTNGDFEAPTISPWIVKNFAVNPAQEKFDTTGIGASKCYAVTPGRKDNTTSVAHILEQKIRVSASTTYEIRLDVAVTWRTSSLPLRGGIEVRVEGKGTTLYQHFNSMPANPWRLQLVTRFKPSTSADVPLQILFSADYVAAPGRGFRVHVDNVDIRPTRQPFIKSWQPVRLIGKTSWIGIEGRSGVAFALFVSLSKANQRLVLPGISGELGLDPKTLLLLQAGIFDASGAGKVVLNVPNLPALSGLPLHWQALQFNAILNVADLGWETTQGFK